MPGSDRLGILGDFEKNSELRSDAGRSKLVFEAGRGESSLWPMGCAVRLLGQMERSA